MTNSNGKLTSNEIHKKFLEGYNAYKDELLLPTKTEMNKIEWAGFKYAQQEEYNFDFHLETIVDAYCERNTNAK